MSKCNFSYKIFMQKQKHITKRKKSAVDKKCHETEHMLHAP